MQLQNPKRYASQVYKESRTLSRTGGESSEEVNVECNSTDQAISSVKYLFQKDG